VSAHNSAPDFGFTSSPAEELAAMRGILSHLAPKKEDDVRMVAAALKTHGPKFEELFFEWATPFGRYKAKGLWAKVKADPDAMTEVIERQVTALSKNTFQPPAKLGSICSRSNGESKGVFPIVGGRPLFMALSIRWQSISFLSLEMAASIGDGLPFFEHATKPAAVLYVGLEGEGGYRGRVVAWQRHHGRAIPDSVRFLLQPFRLTDPQDVADLAAVCPPGCVVFIDTLNPPRARLWTTTSSRDMGAVIEGAKTLQRLIGGLSFLLPQRVRIRRRGFAGIKPVCRLVPPLGVIGDDTRPKLECRKAKDGSRRRTLASAYRPLKSE
jgi:hypothetical protein